MESLGLVPIYLGERHVLLEPLASLLERIFEIRVELRPPWFDAEVSFDASRGQYNSTVVLAQLLQDPRHPAGRILAVTGVDLFIPVLTYVFGEAQLNGRAAVVSLHRLRNEAYGLPADEGLLLGRLEKEAVHELGHTHGLVHCPAHDCVMRSSTYVEEIDLKGENFCDACRAALRPASR